MTVGELRAAIEGVRNDAVLIAEVSDTLLGMQFHVTEVWPIGVNTDDPGLVVKLVRSR